MSDGDIFAALANPTRREVLRLLLEQGEQPVQRLADHFDMRRPSLSEHLNHRRRPVPGPPADQGLAGGRLDTVVTWSLVPEGRGTRLFLDHSGFEPDDPVQRRTFTLLDGGWRSHVWRRLEAVLAVAD